MTGEEKPVPWQEPLYDSEDDCWYVHRSIVIGDNLHIQGVNLSPLRTARERLANGELDSTLKHVVEALLKNEGIG